MAEIKAGGEFIKGFGKAWRVVNAEGETIEGREVEFKDGKPVGIIDAKPEKKVAVKAN